jgi:uncharacterized short protein YbdD (DUF466 family)
MGTGAISMGRWRLARLLRRASSALRAIVGAPDYDRYLAHMRDRHPGRPVLSRPDFERQRLDDRYTRPGNRCC